MDEEAMVATEMATDAEAAVAMMVSDEEAVVSGVCVLVGGAGWRTGGFPPFPMIDVLFIQGLCLVYFIPLKIAILLIFVSCNIVFTCLI
jgi:hypothetical protein